MSHKAELKCLFGHHTYAGRKYSLISQRHWEYNLRLCACGTSGQVSRCCDGLVVSSGNITGSKRYVGYAEQDRDMVYYVGSGWQFNNIFFAPHPKLLAMF